MVCGCNGYFIFFLHIGFLSLFFIVFLLLKFLEFLFHIVFRGLGLHFIGISDKIEIFFVIFIIPLENPRLRFIVFIKILAINTRIKLRNKRRLNVFNLSPIDLIKPTMIFDFFSPILTQSTRTISKQTTDKVNNFKRNRYFRWKIQKLLMMLYFIVNFFIILWSKWCIPYQHFINNDS